MSSSAEGLETNERQSHCPITELPREIIFDILFYCSVEESVLLTVVRSNVHKLARFLTGAGFPDMPIPPFFPTIAVFLARNRV